MGGGGQMVSVYPDELTFQLVELDKPCCCNLKVVNNSEHHVAFKVKTTSPKKYFVRPNASIVQPWDSYTITSKHFCSLLSHLMLVQLLYVLRNVSLVLMCALCCCCLRLLVTLQAQKEYPLDMQCKDKFLIQSTRVPATTEMDEIPPETFNKEDGKVIEEMKLRVVYAVPNGGGSSGEPGVMSSGNRSSRHGSDDLTMPKNATIEEIQTIQRLKEERDSTLLQNRQLQRELDMLKRRRSRKGDRGFSLTFAAFAGLTGLLVGFLISLIFSSPPSTA